MKKCTRADCPELIPEFSKNRSMKDGLQAECTTCRAIMRKKSRENKWIQPIILARPLAFAKPKMIAGPLNDRFKKIQQELKKA